MSSIELRYVLWATSPDGVEEMQRSLTRAEAISCAADYAAKGWSCVARDDDYGHELDLRPQSDG